MPNFDAGTIEAQLTLDRTPFTRGLELARAQYKRYKADYGRLTTTLDLDAGAAALELEAIGVQADRLDGRKINTSIDQRGIKSMKEAEQAGSGLLAAILGLGPALIPVGAIAVGTLPALATGLFSAGAGAGALYLAFSKLDQSKAGQHLIDRFKALQGEVTVLRRIAQAGILPGANEALSGAITLLPTFNLLIGNASSAVGQLFSEAGKALQAPFWHSFFGFLAAEANPALLGMGHLIGNLITAAAGLVRGFEPVGRMVGGGLLTISGRFARFASDSANFKTFVDYILREGPVVAHTFGSLFSVIGQLLVALAPLGHVVLILVGAFAQFLALPILQVFNGLPAPIRATAGALLVLVLLKSRLDAMATSLGKVQTKLTAFKGGGASGALGSLRSGFAGLIGLLGGPWGIAIAGAAVGIGYLAKRHQDAKARVEELTASLDRQTGAVTRSTKAILFDNLAKDGQIKFAKDLGISLVTLTDAAAGSAPAIASLNAQLGPFLAGQDANAAKARALADAVGIQNGKVDQSSAEWKKQRQAALDAQAAGVQLTDAQRALLGATDSTTTAIHGQSAALGALVAKIDSATSKVLDARQANRDWQQSIDDARAALHNNGKSLDINTQKGRDNQAAIDGMVKAGQARVDLAVKQGRGDTYVNGLLASQREQLIRVATRFLGSRDAAQRYIDKIYKIPKSVTTKVNLDTINAENRLFVLQGQLNKLAAGGGGPGTGKPGNTASGTENWKGGLTWVGENGRELLWLPKGSKVTPNSKSEQMMAGLSTKQAANAQRASSVPGFASYPALPDTVILEIDGEKFTAKVKAVVTDHSNSQGQTLRAGKKA